MKLIVIILCCISGSIVFAQTSTLSKAAYSIKYPSSWKVQPTSDGKQFTISAPPDSGVADNFVENLNMVINELSTIDYTAQQYANFSKGYLPQKIKQFVVLENKKGSTPGKDSWYMVFKGVQFGKKLQWKQYYIVLNGRVHILTFTAEASRYKEYSKAVDAMIAGYVAKQ